MQIVQNTEMTLWMQRWLQNTLPHGIPHMVDRRRVMVTADGQVLAAEARWDEFAALFPVIHTCKPGCRPCAAQS